MKMAHVIPIIACVAAAACSASYPLRAVFINDAVHFVGAGDNWFFGRTGFCPAYFSVRSDAGATVWRIESNGGSAICEVFPIQYGVVPDDWVTIVDPEPLQSGVVYILNGDGGDRYYGAFTYYERLQRTLENDAGKAGSYLDPPFAWNEQLAAEASGQAKAQ